MGYQGQIATIPLGQFGINADDPDTSVRPEALLYAKNVCIRENRCEKDFGSERWNQSALGTAIRAFLDFWPVEYKQRVIAVGGNGSVYKYNNGYYAPTELTPEEDAPASLITNQSVYMVAGGAEETGRDRKCFIFTGQDPVQVVTGDGTTRRDISAPAADWSGRNQPIKGIIYRGRLVALFQHTMYFSSATDHEDFTTSPLTMPVYPGESEGLIDAFVYKERLFMLKYPLGFYWLDDSDSNVANWRINKLSDSFGGASVFGSQNVLDDVVMANNYGSMTSLKAAFQLSDVAASDMFNQMELNGFVSEELSRSGGDERHTLYDSVRQIHYSTYRSAGGYRNDRLVQMCFLKSGPQATLVTKDLPSCLGHIRDSFGIQHPHYGAQDGYIYKMDAENRLVGASAYRGSIRTHNMDFFAGDPIQSENMKQFDFIEVVYLPTGNFDLTVKHWIDGRQQRTQTIKLSGESASQLDTMILDSANLNLGAKTSGLSPFSKRIPASGSGRRIAIECYNEGSNQNFILLKINVYYRVLDQKQVTK